MNTAPNLTTSTLDRLNSSTDLLSLAEAAALLGVHFKSVYRALRSNKIQGGAALRSGSGQGGGKIYIRREQLIDAFYKNTLPRPRKAG
ncbi:MAG TPA: helix-turn-helix domain-containing protein [Kaistia sp.]|jgi:hypothetical protein|nr:helix-turn-helix domain-containing protein [Kaistia sp.]